MPSLKVSESALMASAVIGPLPADASSSGGSSRQIRQLGPCATLRYLNDGDSSINALTGAANFASAFGADFAAF